MKYSLSNTLELNRFNARCAKLINKSANVELKEVRKPKSVSQNKYLYVVVTLWGLNYGYTIEEAKQILKSKWGLTYSKNGHTLYQSFADLNSKETSHFIDAVRTWAAKDGCYIPTAEEYLINKYQVDKEIQQNKQYL